SHAGREHIYDVRLSAVPPQSGSIRFLGGPVSASQGCWGFVHLPRVGERERTSTSAASVLALLLPALPALGHATVARAFIGTWALPAWGRARTSQVPQSSIAPLVPDTCPAPGTATHGQGEGLGVHPSRIVHVRDRHMH